MFRTLGYASDALVMRHRSTFEDRGEFIIQRTPEEPDFWSGNQIIYRTAQPDPARCLADFAAGFPGARHVTIGFDIADMPPPGWVAELDGFDRDECDVLSLSGAISAPPLPAGITARRIEGDADWAQVTALQLQTGIEEGYDPESHAPYIARKYARVRAGEALGGAAWFGLFDGSLLVADMGIVWSDDLARFQSVETRASHHRRGLCAALLGVVHGHVTRAAPGADFVIVAETDGDAGRIYRRAGFAQAERLVAVMKPGYPAGLSAAVT